MILVTTLPQTYETIKVTTMSDLLTVLPENLLYPFNVWISGSLSRDGKTAGNLTFLLEGEGDPSSEIMQYFNSLVEPLGISATASYQWRNQSIQAIRIYNDGRLILNKDGSFKEFPTPVNSKIEITPDYLYAILPQTIPFTETLYLAGGIPKNGFSLNDVDIMLEPTEPKSKFSAIRKYFVNILGVKVDVGNTPMPDREPIYQFKLYENGELCHR